MLWHQSHVYLQTFLKKLLSVWHLLLSASVLKFGISSHRRWQLNSSETSVARCSFVSLSEPHWNQVKSEKSRCSAVRRPSKQHYKHRIASSCQPLLTGRSTQTNFRPESMWDEEELTSMWSSFKTAQSWIDVADIRKSTKKSTDMSSPKSAVFITQEVTWRALRDAPKRWMSMKPTHRAGWSIKWVRAVLSSSISSQRRCRQEAGGLTLLLNHRTQRSQSSSNQCCQCVCAVIQNLWLMAPCRTNRESVCVFPSLFFSLWVCENLATLHHYRLRGKHHGQGRYRPSALRCAFLLTHTSSADICRHGEFNDLWLAAPGPVCVCGPSECSSTNPWRKQGNTQTRHCLRICLLWLSSSLSEVRTAHTDLTCFISVIIIKQRHTNNPSL